MANIVARNDARMLPYSTETYAKTAISNAIWLIGEWLTQGRPEWEKLMPHARYIFEPRGSEGAVAILNSLPEAIRHKVFVHSFMQRPHGGERLFEILASRHNEMLDEALRLEWQRAHRRAQLIGTANPTAACVANELLHRLTGPR